MNSISGQFLMALVGLVVGLVTTSTSWAAKTVDKVPVRIGTYDSRSVAVAYAGSPKHEAEIIQFDEALKKAKKQGDTQQIKKADRAVWEFRHRTHRQAFGTWPVDDILKQYPKAVEQVKKNANVTVLVSKWDKKTLAKYKDAEKVDVNEQLVDAMKPKKRQRRSALGMGKHKPLGPKKLEEMLKHEAGKHYLPPPTEKKQEP